MLHIILKFCSSTMFWIFIFIVFCITVFLMVTARESKSQVKNVQRKPNNVELRNVESTNVTIQDWYKTLMVDLKNDLTKTIEEVKALQDEVASLSRKREDLKHDILKQQESYQEMLANFSKELDGKDGVLRTK